MPNLNKRKTRFKDKIRSVKDAEKYLRENKNKKFQKNVSKNWKYDHLKAAEAMSPADKFMEKTIANVMKTGKQQQNTKMRSSTRDLDKFGSDLGAMYKSRMKDEGSDVDPSDPELSGDEILNEIDENNDIFMFRERRRKGKKDKMGDSDDDEIDKDASSYDSNEDLAESSGDSERDDDNIPLTQREENNAQDVDEVMREEEEEDVDSASPAGSDDEIKQILSANKKTKAWKDKNISLSKVENEIDKSTSDGRQIDPKEKRMLEVSKKYQMMQEKEKNENISDESEGPEEFSDIERNIDENGEDENLGKVEWGRNQKIYYGADTETEKLKKANNDVKWQELREEEKIGIEMQQNLAKASRKEDFYDKEILNLMKEWAVHQKEAEIQNEKTNEKEVQENQEQSVPTTGTIKKKPQQHIKKVPRQHIEETQEDAQIELATEVPTEKVVKNWTSLASKGDIMDIVRRDHPELPGIVTELKVTIQEMENVNSFRKNAILGKFPNAIDDSTMFLELLRTYASVLSFFLKLKSQGKIQKNHVIFSRMLQLRRRVNAMREIYQNVTKTMEALQTTSNIQKYVKKHKHQVERIKNEIERQKEEAKAKVESENKKKEQLEKIEKKFKEKEKKIIDEYVNKEERKMTNWQVGDENEKGNDKDSQEARRLVNMRIFKSVGLRRYRKHAIPRLRKKMKYDKAMKLRKIKGYKPYKGQMPQGRDEYNIPINVSHSKKLLSGNIKSF